MPRIQQGLESAQLRREYELRNIYEFLLNGFRSDDIKRITFDTPSLRAVYDGATHRPMSDTVFELVQSAQRLGQLDALLDRARELNPKAYEKFGPYFKRQNRIEATQLQSSESTEPLINPYVVGNPIQPDHNQVFLGRFDIAQSIISEVRRTSQKPSMLLYGRRRMGKTSALLNITSLINDPSIITVYINAQSAKFHTDTNFCFYLVKAICKVLEANSIQLDFIQSKGYLDKNHYRQDPIISLSNFFEDCEQLLQDESLYCLLTIDEYEEIDNRIEHIGGDRSQTKLSEELLLELRATSSKALDLSFCLLASIYLMN